MLAKNLDRMMDILDIVERRLQWDNQQQIRNPNFRKNTNSGKAKEIAIDQTIRPPSKRTMLKFLRIMMMMRMQ